MRRIYLFLFLIAFISCEAPSVKNRRELSKVAEEINEKCPRMLDSETRIDGIDVKEPNTLVYKYTLVNLFAEKIDTVELYRALWPGIIGTIKVSAEMKRLRDADTEIEYLYRDKNNKRICSVYISPKDYK